MVFLSFLNPKRSFLKKTIGWESIYNRFLIQKWHNLTGFNLKLSVFGTKMADFDRIWPNEIWKRQILSDSDSNYHFRHILTNCDRFGPILSYFGQFWLNSKRFLSFLNPKRPFLKKISLWESNKKALSLLSNGWKETIEIQNLPKVK